MWAEVSIKNYFFINFCVSEGCVPTWNKGLTLEIKETLIVWGLFSYLEAQHWRKLNRRGAKVQTVPHPLQNVQQ